MAHPPSDGPTGEGHHDPDDFSAEFTELFGDDFFLEELLDSVFPDDLAERAAEEDAFARDGIVDPDSDRVGRGEEAARRRRRSLGYLSLWAVDKAFTPAEEFGTLDRLLAPVPVPMASGVRLRSIDEVVGRAKALCLCSLKGQGLTQHEVFAFADGYEVWDHLSVQENDFVLDPAPEHQTNVQQAWKTEGLWVLEWALGLVRHLAFPDHPADAARAVEFCISQLCTYADRAPSLELRPMKELLDAADLARVLDTISQAARVQGVQTPAGLHPGVVFERENAFAWLLGRPNTAQLPVTGSES